VTTPSRSAIVLGASGSVGHALIAELIRSGAFAHIVSLTRRAQPEQHTMALASGTALREVILSGMTADAVQSATVDAARDADGDVVGLSVLGIGAGTAKLTIDQHRAVDVELNAAFARGLKASGRVEHLAFMSAVGANPTASTTASGAAGGARYNRVKGEAEEAVKAHGPAVVSIFRPSMIIGSQHTPKLLEQLLPLFSFLTPAKFKSITVAQIARAMIATSLHPPTVSGIYHYPEMIGGWAGQP
jgi:uncharacterized protein YbjT (DUF2867 family)